LRLGQTGGIKLAGRACIDVTFYCLPQTLEEAKGTGHAGIAPLHALLRWSGKHGEEAYGIRAVFPDQLFRVYGVAFGFTHLGAVLLAYAYAVGSESRRPRRNGSTPCFAPVERQTWRTCVRYPRCIPGSALPGLRCCLWIYSSWFRLSAPCPDRAGVRRAHHS